LPEPAAEAVALGLRMMGFGGRGAPVIVVARPLIHRALQSESSSNPISHVAGLL